MKNLWAVLFAGMALIYTEAVSAEVPRIHSIEEGYIETGNALIYYKLIGEGKPLIILHGGPGASHDYLLPWLLPLARTNQLVFIDERGSGRSERLADPHEYTVENMVADVEAVRQALDFDQIDLLGHSYGGVLAQAYALKYQEHLAHLVLASTFPSTKMMNEVLAHERAQMPADKLARMQQLEQAGLFDHGAPWEKGRYTEEYEVLAWGWGYFPFMFGAHPDTNYDPKENAPTNWELYREMWGSHGEFVIDGNLQTVEYVDQLPTLHVPTLILAGDHDECDPSLARLMHEKIEGSELVILPNAGHLAFEDQPELWIRSVREFLNRKGE